MVDMCRILRIRFQKIIEECFEVSAPLFSTPWQSSYVLPSTWNHSWQSKCGKESKSPKRSRSSLNSSSCGAGLKGVKKFVYRRFLKWGYPTMDGL